MIQLHRNNAAIHVPYTSRAFARTGLALLIAACVLRALGK